MSKKSIFIIFLVWFVFTIALLLYKNRTSLQKKLPIISLQLTSSRLENYSVSSCKKGEEFKSQEEPIRLSTSGNSINLKQTLYSYCNASKENLSVFYKIEDDKIEIHEVFDAFTVAKCICPFEIKGKITNLKKGSYQVDIILNNMYANQYNMLESKKIRVD